MRTSALARLAIMSVILMGLLVPILMIWAVVAERTSRRNEAARAVSREWGGAQTLAGPVLTIPYRTSWRDPKGIVQERIERIFLLPDSLSITGSVQPEHRKRGLFEVIVYVARLKASGRFPQPNLTGLRPSAWVIDWENATVDIGVTDPRGIARGIMVSVDGQDTPARPGVTSNGIFSTGVRVPVRSLSAASGALSFAFDIELKGTKDVYFVPGGNETRVELTSSWKHPSFVGGPQATKVGPDGFSATWHVPYFGRGFSAQWTSEMNPDELTAQARISAFGVSLMQPVDIYVQSERAVKYAVLFIVLTFVIAFLWEVTGGKLVHPVQYLFVGFAMCLFYLLLLSLAEHVVFDLAYLCAAAATVGLLAWYWTWVINGVGQGILMGSALALLYGFLYLLLRLEDYALLAGSVGLFAALALVMFLTRRVNWFDLRLGAAAE